MASTVEADIQDTNNHPSSDNMDSSASQEVPQVKVSDEEIEKSLTQLMKDAKREDESIRLEYLVTWKRLEYYWNNILDIFIDPISHEWRVPDWDKLEAEGETPPRLINIYRPHGEAIVAALSVAIPSLIFHPDDADNADDIDAAKAYRNISDLLELHNNAPMLFIRMITILFNQGTIFGYNYYHTDPKFGTYKVPKIESKDLDIYRVYCPKCGAPLDAGVKGNEEVQDPSKEVYTCDTCGYQGPGQVQEDKESLPQIVGWDSTPKGTVCQEIYSGLEVKVPAYVRSQDECGYLLLEFVQATSLLRSVFQDKAGEIESKMDLSYEGFSRLPLQYYGYMPDNASNVSCCWIRPWHFWSLGVSKKDIILELLKRYPDGVYVIHINDRFMEAYPESMDEHWTISNNPLGKFIYARPLGENLATVQDIRAELVEIEVQTAEYGIPETFVDTKVLDLRKYGEGRSRPGMMTAAKAQPGKSLSDAFYASKPAILSQEIDPLRQHIDQDAQFVAGSFPSVYGGPAIGGSKTASEYSQSRAVALQRLGTVWKIACQFWSDYQSRSVIEYANELRELNRDEKFTKRIGTNFINVWIRAVSLSGNVGRCEPEASEQLPTSWAQKKDAISQLLAINNPQILEVLTHPNNAEIMKMAIGLTELYIPGEEDRTRQLHEFTLLSQGVTVPTKPGIDNDKIHIEVLQSLIEGPFGDALDDNALHACMQHLQEHQMNMSGGGSPAPMPTMNGQMTLPGNQAPAPQGAPNVQQ